MIWSSTPLLCKDRDWQGMMESAKRIVHFEDYDYRVYRLYRFWRLGQGLEWVGKVSSLLLSYRRLMSFDPVPYIDICRRFQFSPRRGKMHEL